MSRRGLDLLVVVLPEDVKRGSVAVEQMRDDLLGRGEHHRRPHYNPGRDMRDLMQEILQVWPCKHGFWAYDGGNHVAQNIVLHLMRFIASSMYFWLAPAQYAVQVEDNIQPPAPRLGLYRGNIPRDDLLASLSFYLMNAKQQRNRVTFLNAKSGEQDNGKEHENPLIDCLLPL